MFRPSALSMASTTTPRQRVRISQVRRRLARDGALPAHEARELAEYEAAHPPRAEVLATTDELAAEVRVPAELAPVAPPVAPPLAAALPELPPAPRPTRNDIVDDALRSAVNAQVASLEMMERACRCALSVADACTQRLIDSEQQLVDALTVMAEQRIEQQAQASAPGASDAVADELTRRVLDQVAPGMTKPT